MKGLKSILVAGLLTLLSSAFAQSFMPDQLIVKFKPGSQVVEPQIHAAAGTQVIQRNAQVNWTLVKIPANRTKAQVTAIYQSYPNYVTNVTENPIIQKLDTIPNDPGFPQQWGPTKVLAPKMWDRSQGATTSVVAILDTGVDLDHPDLVANLMQGDDPGAGDTNPDDEDGHGTHCAGIAGAVGNNSIGVAGMGWKNKIMPVKVFGPVGGFALVTGITYATDNGANVISMSLKISNFKALEDAVNYAWGKNVLLIAAAGNDGNQLVNYPAGYDKVLAVASSDPNDGRSGFSTFGDWVDVAAPGSGIYSSTMGGGYGNSSGTSMACPMVAGLAGVLYSEAGITATNQQIWDMICASSDKVNYVKFGRINAWRAINLIEQFKTVGVDPTAASMFIGTKMTGGVALLSKKDNKFAIVSSTLVPATGSTAAAIMDYTLPNPLSTYIDPQIRLSYRTDVPSTMMVFLYNNTSKKWDFIRSAGSKSATTDLVTILPEAMGNYITAQGKIRVLARTHVPVTRGKSASSFRLYLDQAIFEGKVKL